MNENKKRYYDSKTQYATWYGRNHANPLSYPVQSEAMSNLHKALLAQESLEDYVRQLEELAEFSYRLLQSGKAAEWADDSMPAAPYWDKFREIFGANAVSEWERTLTSRQGNAADGDICPNCGSQNTERIDTISDDPLIWTCECGQCQTVFEVGT